jgi:hypothetical protein
MPGSSARPKQASLSSSIVHGGGKRRGVGMSADEKPDANKSTRRQRLRQ